jgi:hypothetical protein
MNGIGLVAVLTLLSLSLAMRASADEQHEEEHVEESQMNVGVQQVANAITELDVNKAQSLLEQIKEETPALAYQRARLAVYVGDCDSAEAVLSALPETLESSRLLYLAKRCARATAGSSIIVDEGSGVWIRIQDEGDRALVPLLIEVAVKSRKALVEDLGIAIPLPMRIDLVRDLFSLSAVSGLPLEAAETTGTVAVARWGRVTMVSPRAPRLGYPWQDTLAHELTHLALSRGSRDYAPLWLQEGIAKREERRWRPERPLDDRRDPYAIARAALLAGENVGIDRIGPSIAMLPTAKAASISYAEVESFMDFWIDNNGVSAFTLLMADLKGLSSRETNEAMLSVSGYPLDYWIGRWEEHLRQLPDPEESDAPEKSERSDSVVQSVRLGELLEEREYVEHASGYFDTALESAPDVPGVRFRASAAQLRLGKQEEAVRRLGTFEQLSRLHGGWLGLHGRMLVAKQQEDRALESFSHAIGIDPYSEEAACEGWGRMTGAEVGADGQARLPSDPVRRKLCEQARKVVRH